MTKPSQFAAAGGAGSRRWCGYIPALALAAGLSLPGIAAAQHYTAYAVGAVDGHDTNLQLAGISVRPEGDGWKPVGSLQAYRLGYASDPNDVSVFSVTPAVGMGYRSPVGSLEGTVGYSFQSGDQGDRRFFEGGAGGVRTTVQGVYWGSQPELQALASYGLRDNSLYSQAQGTYALVDLNPGNLGAGGEVAWQGDLGTGGYSALQFGPVLRWTSGAGLVAALSGGWQTANLTDDTWYTKVTFVYAP